MIIDHTNKFIYVSTPKAGTHTMYRMLGTKYGIHKAQAYWIKKENYFGPGTCEQIGMHESNTHSNVLPVNNYHVFTTVRNPYDRAVSSWWHLLGSDEELSPQRKSFRNFFKKHIGEELSFDGFVRWLPTRHNIYKPTEPMMFNSQSEWHHDIKFDKVIKLEELIENTYGFLEDCPVTQDYSFKRGQNYYTDELKEIVAKTYRRDFERYGYDI